MYLKLFAKFFFMLFYLKFMQVRIKYMIRKKFIRYLGRLIRIFSLVLAELGIRVSSQKMYKGFLRTGA